MLRTEGKDVISGTWPMVTKWQDLIAKNCIHFGCKLSRNQYETVQETPSILASFHFAGRWYDRYWGTKRHQCPYLTLGPMCYTDLTGTLYPSFGTMATWEILKKPATFWLDMRPASWSSSMSGTLSGVAGWLTKLYSVHSPSLVDPLSSRIFRTHEIHL